MGTKQEQTLEIKDFRGVSRYLASPNEPPNKLFTLQNLYSPNRGELAYLPGIAGTSLSADGFSNLIGDFNYNGQRLLFNKSTVGVLPNPSNANFSFASAGGATSAVFRLSFVGMGYETDIANSPVFSVSSMLAATTTTNPCGVTLTLINANTIPNTVSAINIYIADVDTITKYVVCGTIFRNNKGAFPSSYQLWAGLPIYDTTPPSGSQVYQAWDLTSLTITPINDPDGQLVGGQTYFFGFAPYVLNSSWTGIASAPPITPGYTPVSTYYYPIVQQAFWQTTQYISYTMPLGSNAFKLQDMNVSSLWDGVGGHTYYNVFMFIGTSPEDMLWAQWKLRSGVGGRPVYCGPAPLAELISLDLIVTGTSSSHNNGITMVPGATQQDAGTSTTRLGMFVPTQQIHKPGAETVGCLAFEDGTLDYAASSTTCYQINPCRGYGRFSNDSNQNATGLVIPDCFRVYHGGTTTIDRLQGISFGGSTKRSTRFFMVNNFQLPFYTDGFSFKQISKDLNTADPPICSSIIAFQNQLVMGGGPTGTNNVQGNVFWSQVDGSGNPNPFAWSPVATPPVNNSAALFGDSSGDILGFGIFSYNQAVNSVTTQLVVGLTNSIWMTPSWTTSPSFQEVARNIGFASPNCFVNTNIGAFFLGRDNLYQFNTYGIPVAKGQDFLGLIQGMLKSNTSVPPLIYYHNNQIKVLYHVSATDPNTGALLYDTEIWCDVQLEKNEQINADVPRFVWTGPHTMHQTVACATFPTGVYTDISSVTEDYRTGCNSTTAMILGYPGKTSNMGANVARSIVFNDLYLGVDDFVKLLSRLYIGGKSTKTATITITFNMTDQNGAGMGTPGAPTSFSDTIVFNPNNVANAYMQTQKLFSSRYRGRIVNQLTLAWNAGSSEETINIYEIAILFYPQHRRLL